MGNRFGEAEAWDSIGYAHHHLGENGQAAAECYRHALAIFQELEGRYGEAEVLSHLGDAHEATGELDAARQAWRQALALSGAARAHQRGPGTREARAPGHPVAAAAWRFNDPCTIGDCVPGNLLDARHAVPGSIPPVT